MRFNSPQLINQVKVYNSTPTGPADIIRYNAPVETDLSLSLYSGEIALTSFDRRRPTTYYWSLPAM